MATHSELIRAACPNDGDQTAAARRCGISVAFFNQIANGRRRVPVAKGATIERELGVLRRDLWPDRWHVIWPELQQVPSAPEMVNTLVAPEDESS